MAPIPRQFRVLIVAPFERGLDHGGSQRATALAEKLEERGFTTAWQVIDARPISRAAKARAMLAMRPTGIALRPPGQLRPHDGFDAAIAAHSYLAPQLDALPPDVVRVIDFHNLEWQHLADSSEFAAGPRGVYLQVQTLLMRRFERRVLAANQLSLFTSKEEIAWARAVEPYGEALLLPSILPRAAEATAQRLSERRKNGGDAELVYIGTLRFPPNLGALEQFLRTAWPAIRSLVPDVRLSIAGDCAEEDLRALNSHPGVEALGFVKDVAALLERSAAVVMPISGQAGTSLRALFYALSGIWTIGTPAASRGVTWELGATVETPEQWAQAVHDASRAGSDRDRRLAEARSAAGAIQHDPEPWDDLGRRVVELAASGARRP